MYDGCFGLTRRPFAAVPQIDHYFPATTIEGARTTLTRCIQRGEGTGLVVGPSGTGKTLLCLVLAEQFRRSFQVVMLANGRLSSRRALFQAILYELGRPYRGMDEGEARLAVVDHLLNDVQDTRGVVLLVDEAHTLPLRLLDEIRLLTNLVGRNQPLVRAVLVGGPSLEERFANPKLDSFSQRLGVRCYLESLNQTETETYIQSQIEAAGGHGKLIFPKDTCQSVFQATGGVPRLINQLCDHALLLAYVAGRQQISAKNIEEAWADLQQLPTPWMSSEKKAESSEGVVEFGSLDDQFETVSSETGSATLRVAAEDEGAEVEAVEGEPSDQFHRIERLLAETEEDEEFEPAGSIGPEVELYFDGVVHPFAEEFEHEELVADRYAGAGRWDAVSFDLPKASLPVAKPLTAATGRSNDEEQLESIARSADELLQAVGAKEEPEMAISEDSYEFDFSESEKPSEDALSAKPVASEASPLKIQSEGPTLSTTPVAAAAPRRREYRQLFARLQRID
jgi:type II secretory pathway predicted ATPase ExeA